MVERGREIGRREKPKDRAGEKENHGEWKRVRVGEREREREGERDSRREK